MGLDFFLTLIVWLLIAGFVFWAVRKIIGLIPLEPIFKQVIDVILIIAVVAIILFKVVIPLLSAVVHAGGSFHL